jgi:hypothetical protein
VALEAGARWWLPAPARSALPHVGLGKEAQDRLRWLERRKDGGAGLGLMRPDPVLGWRPRPGVRLRQTEPGVYDVEVSTDGEGLRGARDISREPAPGVARVALFGCSQTFGTGVADDETYGAQLERMLPGVEVLNFGVGGYGTDQMLLYWESVGEAFRPDVVVLAFAFYHVERNVAAFRFFAKPRFELGAGGALALTGTPVPTPEVLATARGAPHAIPFADRSVLLRWGWQRVLRGREVALYQADTEAWRVTQALITRFAESVRASGAHMLLVNLDHGAGAIEEEVMALAVRLDVDFLDVGAVLQGVESHTTRLRLRGDPHFNADGHAVIAAALRDHLGDASRLRRVP